MTDPSAHDHAADDAGPTDVDRPDDAGVEGAPVEEPGGLGTMPLTPEHGDAPDAG